MAFDAFLKIDSIPGESKHKGHEGWIQVLSFEHGVTQPHQSGVAGGRAAGVERCDHLDFSILKTIDKATSKLNLYCCNGKNLGTVKLEICKPANGSQVAYLTYEFEKCAVRSVMASGAAAANGQIQVPSERITLSYSKISWKYKEVDDTGAVKGNSDSYWDMLANTGG